MKGLRGESPIVLYHDTMIHKKGKKEVFRVNASKIQGESTLWSVTPEASRQTSHYNTQSERPPLLFY